jgi:hypothetical protein
MNYNERKNAISALNRYKRKLNKMKFTYGNFFIITKMIFETKNKMEDLNPDRIANNGLHNILKTIDKEWKHLYQAKIFEDKKDKFIVLKVGFSSDLEKGLIALGAYK